MSQELCTSMEKAPQRALLKALGLSDAEIEKPLIAVITAKSEIVPGNTHLDRITDAVKAGVYAGGCTPVVVPTISVCDGLSMGHAGMRYALPARELIADCVETELKAHGFDGAVFVPNSDKAIAGMLMGAARVNIPSVFVTGGPMETGKYKGKKVGFSTMYESIGAVNQGEMSRAELDEMESVACPGFGSTTGTLNCLPEALGMALPGDGTALATSGERIRLAKRAGLSVCELVRDAVTPRMIMTKRAFNNAVTLDMAIGGSTNTVLHLLAIADECNVALNLDAVAQISDKTPVLYLPFPASDFGPEDFHLAGGVCAVLHELAKNKLIDGSIYTVHGCALADDYDHAHVADENVIRKIDDPISPVGGVTVLRGNLAEDGALAKRTAENRNAVFVGKAKCFNCEEDAIAAIVAGRIKSGDVLVIRYEGPVGGPGMREIFTASSALIGAGLRDQVAVITDGRLSDYTRGLAVGHVCPEAAEDGKLALVADGDAIKIDMQNGRITLDVPAKMLDARRKKLRPKDSNASGRLLRYQNLVTPAYTGAVLKKKF